MRNVYKKGGQLVASNMLAAGQAGPLIIQITRLKSCLETGCWLLLRYGCGSGRSALLVVGFYSKIQ